MQEDLDSLLSYIREMMEEMVSYWRATVVAIDYPEIVDEFELAVKEECDRLQSLTRAVFERLVKKAQDEDEPL